MFDKIVADLLTNFFGEYFADIDREQVKVSLWKGQVNLRNLKVRHDALRFFNVPVCVLMGTIEELTVVIPWSRLRSESMVVQIRNAKLLLADKETAAYSIDQEKREERARKDRELGAADEALLAAYREKQQTEQAGGSASAAVPAASCDRSDSNFTARLKASILNNIRVEVQQLYVRYTSMVPRENDGEASHATNAEAATVEAAGSSQQQVREASVAFKIDEMKTCGCNVRFEPAFVAPGERVSRQLIAFRGLAASLRTGAGRETELPLLRPFDVSLEVAYQPVVLDTTTPQYMLAVRMEQPCACVMTSEGCTTLYDLLQCLRRVHDRQSLRRLRPIGDRPTTRPRLWWRYAMDAVQQQVRRAKCATMASAHRSTPFSWLTYTATKAKRDRYMSLYLRRQRVALSASGWLEPLSVDEHVEMMALEEELSIEMLKLAKRLAMERCTVERAEYEKLLRQKRATAAAVAASSPTAKTAGAASAAARENAQRSSSAGSQGGWFSFWRSTPQQGHGAASESGDADVADDLDDETRAELRKLVQLMTAEQWTDAQRTVIAQEFGMSAEEARDLASTRRDGEQEAALAQRSRQNLRAAPSWVVFVRAVAVSFELQDVLLHAGATAPTRRTLARLSLSLLHGGAEWGSSGGTFDATLPVAYYWGTVDRLAIAAAKLKSPSPAESAGGGAPSQDVEEEILLVRRPATATEGDGRAKVAQHPAKGQQRPFSPLEACWSIVSDECRRSAAWQMEWTQRSSQQMTSRVSAAHRVRVRLAPLHLLVDVVPLRHLTDFFFTVVWPHPGSGSRIERSAADGAGDAFLTALQLPTFSPLTHIEQRCATDPQARLIILRRRVERQHSVEWDVCMDCVTLSIAEIPDVQGCELVLEKLTMHNDIAHRLQRQERLQCDADGTSPLGTADTDWFDYTHAEAASTSLAVFLPAHQGKAPAAAGSDASVRVLRRSIVAATPFAVVVERSLLGRCSPERPPYKLRVSSASAVELAWSRSTLSVLATSCSTVADLAASIGETLLQRERVGNASMLPNTAASLLGGEAAVSTFHVAVVPHLTHTAYWHGDEATSAVTQLPSLDDTDLYYKQMHPFSATRLARTTGREAAASRRRVDVRRGVCVLYHPERLTAPATYYTLQEGCTRVRRTETTDEDGKTQSRVHLYVSQGGADHTEVLTAAYAAAQRVLLDTVGVPAALLGNAVWLGSAVHAWLAQRSADTGAVSDADVLRALALVVKGTHLVPCQYLELQCDSAEQAARLTEALERSCVDAAAPPPLVLTSAVQTAFTAALGPAGMRKMATFSLQLDFPALQMTCEGQEPAECSDGLPSGTEETNAGVEAHNYAMAFTPFAMRYDHFPDRQRFELSVAGSTEMFACRPRSADSAEAGAGGEKLMLLRVGSRAAAPPGDAPASLFLRFVLYHRPQPLPSMKRCAIHVHPSATATVTVGGAMLSWAEAWWDSLGILTNRLFAEEVVAGHPWWSPSPTALFEQPRREEAAWCAEAECGGNMTSIMLDLSVSSVKIQIAPQVGDGGAAAAPVDQPAVFRFAARETALHWRLTESRNSVQLSMRGTALQWRHSDRTGGVRMGAWVDVMRCADADAAASRTELAVNWKLHKPPPMLSSSDWLCSPAAAPNCTSAGLRDRQELQVELSDAVLFYWHPLLLHMIHSIQDGVLRRATTVANREPCWFHNGVLHCPPLSWPHQDAPLPTRVSWERMGKKVTLRRVEVLLPEDMSWMQHIGSTAPASAASLHAAELVYQDGVEASPATDASRCSGESVQQLHTLEFTDVRIARRGDSAALSTLFVACLPRWTVGLTTPLFHASSIWTEGNVWQKEFHIALPRRNAATSHAGSADAHWHGTTADVAFLLYLAHASYVDVKAPAFASDQKGGDSRPQPIVPDTSPASLLKPVTEASTWRLDVEPLFEMRVHAAETPASCSRSTCVSSRLAGAHVEVAQSKAGELSCTLEAALLFVGGAGGEAAATGNSDVVPLLSFPHNPAEGSTPPRLRLQYGWRWLAEPATTAERALYCSLEVRQVLLLTVDVVAAAALQKLWQEAALRESLERYQTASARPAMGWAKASIKVQCEGLECHLPCTSPHQQAATAALCLSAQGSHVSIRARKDGDDWRGMLQLGRLEHFVLREVRTPGESIMVPLLLEQPSGWSQPVTSSPNVTWRRAPSPVRPSPQTVNASRPPQPNMLDELFGELPSPVTAAPLPSQQSAAAQTSPLTNAVPAAAHVPVAPWLTVNATLSPSRVTFATAVEPVWLITPSMVHMSRLLTGLRTQLGTAAATPLAAGTQSTSSASLPTQRSFAVDVTIGAVSVFVAQNETIVPHAACTARQVETAVRQSLESDALLLATEALGIHWDSETAAPGTPGNVATESPVMELKNTSICALRGLEHSTVLLERFSIRVTRRRTAEEEAWSLALEPLQLTLTQFHYDALLRVVVQQTSFLAATMGSASMASHTMAAAAAAVTEDARNAGEAAHSVVAPPSVPKRFRFQLSSLSLRIEEDEPSAEAVTAAQHTRAVYVRLEDLDATYYAGNGAALHDHNDADGLSVGRASGEPLRFAMHLRSCLVGCDGAIPTLSLAPPVTAAVPRDDATAAPAASLVLRITENEATGARRGLAQVRLITVTLETLPVMAWAELLYAPYLQVVVPHYETAKEVVMQRDLCLTEDLVLTERTPLRVVNKSYSLLYLYAGRRTIYLNAVRRGQLIFLDEGVTLRIMHAVVCMDGESIESYVSAGHGSYVTLDRETCTIVRPADLAAPPAAVDRDDPLAFLGTQSAGTQQATLQSTAAASWTELEGTVQVQLRVPEPRAHHGRDGARTPGSSQRTLVVYSDMQLSLLNTAVAGSSGAAAASELSGSFVLAHAGVRSEYVTAQGTSTDVTDIVSDWAMTVSYAEEHAPLGEGDGATHSAMPHADDRQWQLVRHVSVDAGAGVEVRVRYSDVFFVLRSLRHAQAALARGQGALRQDLWSSLLPQTRSWDVESIEGGAGSLALPQERGRVLGGGAASAEVDIKTVVAVQIPYLSFIAVDDSRAADTPLFCVYVNDIRTPSLVMESPHVKAELHLRLQLEYYDVTNSQWAPVLDPVMASLALNWRKNTSVADVYNRQGFVRMAVQTSSVRLYFTLGLLRNLRQLQLLRAQFEAAGADLVKAPAYSREEAVASDGSVVAASPTSFTALKLLQTTGVEVEARLPDCVADPVEPSGPQRAESSRVLPSGESWAFDLPRVHGKDLPRAQQKVFVQHHTSADGPRRSSVGAVVSVASVGVRRVPLSTCGPLQRYIVADVAVPPEQQGQKQLHLHSTVLFRNQLSVSVLQLAPNARGTYDTVGVVPPGASVHVPVDVLRRRVCLAVLRHPDGEPRATPHNPPAGPYDFNPAAIARLGVSYDCLACLTNQRFLCVSQTAEPAGADGGGRHAAGPPRLLAKGKLFDVYAGAPSKAYFFLHVREADEQPADVQRYPALNLLRCVTVTTSAAVTIHNAVGLPITVTLLTRRVKPGVRTGLLDTSPDTAVYTAVNTTVIAPDARYGASEMDLLDDVCVSVSLEQPGGNTMAQWFPSRQESRGAATAHYAPACIYRPGAAPGRDKQIVLMDAATGATLVLSIQYVKDLVTFYCPQWIVNETHSPIQLADTSAPQAANAARCTHAIAGLGGTTLRTATVMPSGELNTAQKAASAALPFLYHSLRAEACSRNNADTGANGLYVRVWEVASSADGGAAPQGGFSGWSSQPLRVDQVAEVQVVTCASRLKPNTVVVLSCRVELGSQTALHAYSNTRVVFIRPRWVVVNKSPYTLRFLQAGGRRAAGELRTAEPYQKLMVIPPFAEATVPPIALAPSRGTGGPGGRPAPLLCFAVQDDAEHNVRRCCWSSSVPLDEVHEEATNLVYHTLVPLAEYWPQSSSISPTRPSAAQCIPDSLPPLQPDDIKEVHGELFVDRTETMVLVTTAYAYKGCMMCVEVEEAAQPPIVVENRTSYTVCFRQRGGPRVSTVFPRCRKAWTWDVPPSNASTPAVVELWLAQEQDTAQGSSAGEGGGEARRSTPSRSTPATVCVLNFDPQQLGQQSRNSRAFQQEIEVDDPVHGTSTMLFVRVRGVHGMSYAVSITTEPTIDAYRTLPFPRLSFALQVESIFALLRGEHTQDMLMCAVEPLSFTFAQGTPRRRDGANASDPDIAETDVQRVHLRFSTFQVDDERRGAKERVVAQLIADRESGFQLERKLLRTTPLLYYPVVDVNLVPIELHVEDSFITAMMGYYETVHATWAASASPVHRDVDALGTHAGGTGDTVPLWQRQLQREALLAGQSHADAQQLTATDGRAAVVAASRSRRAAPPLWGRVVAIDRFLIDPVVVSLSLYRSPGAADDPLWKIAGAASLLVGSTQDARLQWEAVDRRRVCDTIWHLLFVLRNSYEEQMKNQYMTLVNVMGLGTVRNFVSDLLSAYSDEPPRRQDSRGGGGAGSRGAAARRQMPRVPRRPRAQFCVDEPASRRSTAARAGRGVPMVGQEANDDDDVAEMPDATTRWVQEVPPRQVVLRQQFKRTVLEAATLFKWEEFTAVAQPAEIRAFGGASLAGFIATMPWTRKLSYDALTSGGGRLSMQSVATASADAARVQCSRCVELEALRAQRLRDGAATPLPHPIRDGFLTWEEFAHHINWFEFVDMCTDEEIVTYASRVRAGASEASSNVCLITYN